jgi:hypothetical protein
MFQSRREPVTSQEAVRRTMLTVYDVEVELRVGASPADVNKLKDHFKALKINSVGLDGNDFRSRSDGLSFSIYGDVGPFMMKRMVLECTENVFPGSIVDLLERG